MTNSLIRPVTCSRCKGTGRIEVRRAHRGIPGLCFKCDGKGSVEGDKATIQAAKDELKRKQDNFKVAQAWFATRPEARKAFDVLQYEDTPRSVKAVASIAAGHPGVEKALLDYYAAWKAARG